MFTSFTDIIYPENFRFAIYGSVVSFAA